MKIVGRMYLGKVTRKEVRDFAEQSLVAEIASKVLGTYTGNNPITSSEEEVPSK